MQMQKRRDDDGLTTHVLDMLAPWAEVNARRMFGGIGLFAHGLMFAIIIEDVLFMKDSKDDNGNPVKTDFEKEYFEYDRNGKTVNLGYFKVPDDAMEDSSYLIRLANDSLRSASLTKRSKPKAQTKSSSKRATTSAKQRKKISK